MTLTAKAARIDSIATYACASDIEEQRCASFRQTVTRSSNSFSYGRANNHEKQKTEMLQKARAALPLTRIRERAFEGAFFSVALIAMAGWVYFITLLLVRLFLWFFG